MGESPKGLDRLDKKILEALVENGRLSWRDLAETVGLSETPTVRRVRALEAAGYIGGYNARIDETAAGRPISIFVSVSLRAQNDKEIAAFETAIATSPLIMSCYMMAGDVDYLMRVVVADIAEFHSFLGEVIRPIPGVEKISSSFALKAIIQRVSPPL
jgi:DNA-binding Lrp family transcriptional regulator